MVLKRRRREKFEGKRKEKKKKKLVRERIKWMRVIVIAQRAHVLWSNEREGEREKKG